MKGGNNRFSLFRYIFTISIVLILIFFIGSARYLHLFGAIHRLLFNIYLSISLCIIGIVSLCHFLFSYASGLRVLHNRLVGIVVLLLVIWILVELLEVHLLVVLWMLLISLMGILCLMRRRGYTIFVALSDLVSFALSFLAFQMIMVDYKSYVGANDAIVESVSLGIPFLYWIKIIDHEGSDISYYVYWDRMLLNILMVAITYVMVRNIESKHFHRRILYFAYIIHIVPFMFIRSFIGSESDYLCDCYGFPIGFVKRCSYIEGFVLDYRGMMFSLVWVMFVFVVLHFLYRKYVYLAIRVLLLSVVIYLMYGTTHMCDLYILGYLGYRYPSLYFEVLDAIYIYADLIDLVLEVLITMLFIIFVLVSWKGIRNFV